MADHEVRLAVGSQAPDFTLLNQGSNPISFENLPSGNQAILYFYPAAASPGCTKEAADFQESLEAFQLAGYSVVGISPDEPSKLARFAEDHDLSFELLSDPELTAHKSFGAFGEKTLYGRTYTGVLRSTIVVDAKGVVAHALYNVKATGHVAMLRRILGV